MKKTKKIVDFFQFCIMCMMIIFVIVLLIGHFMGMKTYITMSGSMEPSIKTGSICIVDTNATYDEVKIGDVIVFSPTGKQFVTHRAIAITESGIETQGDNNNVSDGISTTPENFVGKTLISIPYIGYVIRYCQNKYVMSLIVSIIVAFTIMEYVLSEKEG